MAEALIGGFVDVAVLGPYGYITAKKEDLINNSCNYAKKKGYMQNEGPGYQSVLITKKGSKFTDQNLLRARLLDMLILEVHQEI